MRPVWDHKDKQKLRWKIPLYKAKVLWLGPVGTINPLSVIYVFSSFFQSKEVVQVGYWCTASDPITWCLKTTTIHLTQDCVGWQFGLESICTERFFRSQVGFFVVPCLFSGQIVCRGPEAWPGVGLGHLGSPPGGLSQRDPVLTSEAGFQWRVHDSSWGLGSQLHNITSHEFSWLKWIIRWSPESK